jgi:hypothetical protein
VQKLVQVSSSPSDCDDPLYGSQISTRPMNGQVRAEDKESDQRVSFEYCSSFCRTLEIASRMPMGRKSKSFNPSLFFTTVG